MGTPEAPLNDSKGCGGVMRMAPIALLARAPGVVTTPATADTVSGADSRADDLAFEIGSRCAAVTHGHPSGYLAAGALALLISRILAGDTLEAASRRAVRALRNEPRGRECASALEQAMALWHSEAPVTPETVERIGGGWVAEEALAIALFSSLAAGGDFTRGVLLAANHSGDSDSTAAITGNILGALLGREAIPSEWAANVEAGDVIDSLSARLHGVRATLPAPDQRHMVGPG
jgi:ADP-ribosylglycohydrolase